MKRLLGTLALLSLVTLSQAAPITPGNIVVLRVGTGAAALSSAGTAMFLDEFTPTGTPVQSIPVPTTTSGANLRMVMNGTSTAEGGLTISPDGRYVAFGGYDAATGTASISTTATATVNRVVGVLDLTTGTIDSSTRFTTAFSGQSLRGALTDGTNVWAVGGTSGVQATTLGGAGTGTQLSTTPTNLRRVEIFNGQLYIGAAAASFSGVSTVGAGIPTTSGQTTSLLSGFSGTQSSYDFWFADSSTLFVADDRATASGGGIQKWTLSGATWSLAYTMTGASVGLRGLTGLPGSGPTTLFGLTTDNRLVSVSDTGAGATFTTLATGATNTALRGLERMPSVAAPEPGTLFLLALGAGAGIIGFRRRKK
jgi:hypothetical protein